MVYAAQLKLFCIENWYCYKAQETSHSTAGFDATMFHSQDLKGLAKPIEEQAVYLLVQANSQTGK